MIHKSSKRAEVLSILSLLSKKIERLKRKSLIVLVEGG